MYSKKKEIGARASERDRERSDEDSFTRASRHKRNAKNKEWNKKAREDELGNKATKSKNTGYITTSSMPCSRIIL